MKFRGFSSEKVEEKPPVSIVATVTSSSIIPQSRRSMEKMESESSCSMPPETPPWDYFGLSHPIDNRFSSPRGKGKDEMMKKKMVTTFLFKKGKSPETLMMSLMRS
ncbi:hypothetical protein Rs2_09903 [Raphanus sativus]|nr:hypothetical protein Rs2_09903 [Raphanus sativus]